VTGLIASVAGLVASSTEATSGCASGAVLADVALLIASVAGGSFLGRAIDGFVTRIATCVALAGVQNQISEVEVLTIVASTAHREACTSSSRGTFERLGHCCVG
jgi:hypothetical protein